MARRSKRILPPIRPKAKAVKKVEKKLRNKVLDVAWLELTNGLVAAESFKELMVLIDKKEAGELIDLDAVSKIVDDNAGETAEEHRLRLERQFKNALDADIRPFLQDASIAPAIRKRNAESIRLIKTIPERLKARLHKEFAREITQAPFDSRRLTKILQKGYGIGGYVLRRIVRDQQNKLVGKLTELRQLQVGIHKYFWQSSGDVAVRETHQENHGQEFDWANPPPQTGHPGWDHQCRCAALPVIPASWGL